MDKLLAQYSLTEILIFLFIFGAALKTVISMIDYFWERLVKIFKKQQAQKQHEEDFNDHVQKSEKQIKELYDMHAKTEENLDKILNSIQLLINSDKDDIKAWITEKHHYYCYERKYIDDYSLDCIEKRYTHYRNEGGNSFIEDLMKDIRRLPKTIDSVQSHHNKK
jgi:Na+/phosphate symporter